MGDEPWRKFGGEGHFGVSSFFCSGKGWSRRVEEGIGHSGWARIGTASGGRPESWKSFPPVAPEYCGDNQSMRATADHRWLMAEFTSWIVSGRATNLGSHCGRRAREFPATSESY